MKHMLNRIQYTIIKIFIKIIINILGFVRKNSSSSTQSKIDRLANEVLISNLKNPLNN